MDFGPNRGVGCSHFLILGSSVQVVVTILMKRLLHEFHLQLPNFQWRLKLRIPERRISLVSIHARLQLRASVSNLSS